LTFLLFPVCSFLKQMQTELDIIMQASSGNHYSSGHLTPSLPLVFEKIIASASPGQSQ
jgi:hypothetical protein